MSAITPFAGDSADSPIKDLGPSAIRWLPLLAVVFALLLGGCGGGGGGGGGTANPPPSDGGDYGDDGGDGGDSGDGGDGGDDGAVEPTLASIQENVFTPICTQCHTGASAPQGLRLDADVAYAMLVNIASAEVPELLRVDPGNPDGSYIIHKLEGSQTVGERMPLGGPYLPDDTIAAIRQWISDGAMESSESASAGMAKLSGAWPVPDSTLEGTPGKILLVADSELDVSLLRAGLVQVLRVDDVNPVTLQARSVEDLGMRITSLSPTVIELDAPAESWKPGLYEVRVDGSGALAVADRSGRVIDGDADGKPGGDFVMHFAIESGQ